MTRPRIGLLLGDPCGIGPELVARLLGEGIDPEVTTLVIGEPRVLARARAIVEVDADPPLVASVDKLDGQ